MDVSFTNVLEGARQYFQGLPAPSTSSSLGLTATTTIPSSLENNVVPASSYDYDPTGSTKISCSSTMPLPHSSSDDQRRDRDDGQATSFWNSSTDPSGLRSVDPYAPQPTRVEVPDTRPPHESPGEEPNSITSTGHSLMEMQPSRQRHDSSQEQQLSMSRTPTVGGGFAADAVTNHPPQLHQMQSIPNQSRSPAPVYQQLNNVSRPSSSSSSSYAPNEMINPHSTYQNTDNRTSAVPVVQRTQYYPRYHHPDITKSAPVPFSHGSMYQSSAPPSATSPSATHQHTTLRPSPVELPNSTTLPRQNNTNDVNNVNNNTPLGHQRQQTQRLSTSSSYPSTSPVANSVETSNVYSVPTSNPNTGNYRANNQLHQQCRTSISSTNAHNQHVATLHNPVSEASIPHSSTIVPSSVSPSTVPSSSSNPCNSRYVNQSSHIPTSHNHPGHIPSSHQSTLPTVASLNPALSSSSSHVITQQLTQLQQHQFQHHQHSSRIGTVVGTSHVTNSSSYTVKPVNPYLSGATTCNSPITSPRQMLPPASSSSSSSSSNSVCRPTSSPLDQNHHASPTPHRQSPHVSVVHNPHAVSPHHAPSPHHHAPSPHNSSSFQPQSTTYAPGQTAPQRQTQHPYNIAPGSQQYNPGTNYSNPYPTVQPPPHHGSSYHGVPKTSQQPQNSYYSQSSNRSQYGHMPVAGPPTSQQNSHHFATVGNNVNDNTRVNDSYHNSETQNSHNAVDSKRSSNVNQASYGAYRIGQTQPSRSGNTHNLPPIVGVSSYNSNKTVRETIARSQSNQRQRTQTGDNNYVPVTTSSSSLSAFPPRASEYSHGQSAINPGLNERIGTIGNSNNPRYTGQQAHTSYATTIAPSNSSCSTTVTAMSSGIRISAPTSATLRVSPSFDPSNRSEPHSNQRSVDNNYSSKDYAYGNSATPIQPNQSRPMANLPNVQIASQTNGVPTRKRESPLDLSVKTIKTPADSTARDDFENNTSEKHVSSTNVSCSRSNGVRPMIPPSFQPPSVNSYVTYDSRNVNNSRQPTSSCLGASTPQTVCAPKVDFLPDFNSTPLRNHHTTGQLGNPENSSIRVSSRHLYETSQHPTLNALPRISTFKKTSLPSTPIYDNKNPSTSQSSMGDSTTIPRLSTGKYPAVVDPTRKTLTSMPLQEYPTDPSKYNVEGRTKYGRTRDRAGTKRSAEPPCPEIVGNLPNKQPRLDTWRLAIDKQIQQKLSTAKALHEQQRRQEMNLPVPLPNGTLISPGSHDRKSDNSCPTDANRCQTYCDKRNCSETGIPVSPASYNRSVAKNCGVHPLSQPSEGQTSYAGYKQSQRSSYALGAAAQPPETPSNTGADKRVLSLLRNSLENKQQREEQLNSQQPMLVNHSQQSFQNKVVAPVEPKANIGRHNLSPFTAASLLERNSNTPPHYKFHVPRAVDSITQDIPRSLYGSRVNSSATLPGKEALLGPRGIDNQIRRDKDDGLAAILAAKIRTKAELKQVCPGQFVSKPTSVPSQDASATPTDMDRSASTSTPQSAGSSAGSPPKLTREKTACLPPRRRLFSRTDEESLPVAATIPIPAPIVAETFTVPARASGFRSSSETSVFDFRESDSEGEMPVLERQTLEEMRRDRKQLSKVQPPVPLNDAMCMGVTSSLDLVKIELKENDKSIEPDSFWTVTCDNFIAQLRNGDSAKKRGRKKKSGESSKLDDPEDDNTYTNLPPLIHNTFEPIEIKQEIIESPPPPTPEPQKPQKSPIPPPIPQKTKKKQIPQFSTSKPIKSEPPEKPEEKTNFLDDPDELPLIIRTGKKNRKKDDSDVDDDVVSRKRRIRRGSRIKLESSSNSESSTDEETPKNSSKFSHVSSVAQRLRTRKRSAAKTSTDNEGMKLRSRDATPQKIKQDKDKKSSFVKSNSSNGKSKPKPLFGDGSDFRPGWEDEVYVYKKSLRMPPGLITVSKPSRFHRLSTSLPDLDAGSPVLSVSMDSSDVCLVRKPNVDSDVESNCSFVANNLLVNKIYDEEATSSTTISCPSKTTSPSVKPESNSIVDLLARKVGTGHRESKKKIKEKEKMEKIVNKTLPRGSNQPELLATPSLSPLLGNEIGLKAKGKTPVKTNKISEPINVTDSYLLGYFRKETVNNFRNTFRNNHALPNEFSTFVLKTRTRTETRVLKKQATMREVFGEERPASAPPMQNHAGDTSQDDESQNEIGQNLIVRTKKLRQKVVTRLRNVGMLRSQKAVLNSKRHLLTAKKREDLTKSLAEKKLSNVKNDVEDEAGAEEDGEEEEETNEPEEEEEEADTNGKTVDGKGDCTEIAGKKKFKLRTSRRKFRSGFDYMRKKKKPLKKDETVPKERKKAIITRPNAECVADIQSEIRTWVIKKGVGETILHRAARLGYTDVTAYCLEKLNSPPSPKDNAGYTPLHEACSRGHLEIAKLLLAYGANASESANGGIRPLHEAAENGATELVRLLLSYGADPLLATYSGQTPLMLAVDTDAYSILEQHLSDVQGRTNTPWCFGGPSTIFDLEETGYNSLEDPPPGIPEPELEEIEMEVSDVNLPVLFTLVNDTDKWILLQDLMTALKVKSRDALLRQVNPKASSGPAAIAHREVMRELKLHDFLEQSRCCHLLSGGERINVRGSKVTLIKYNDKVRSLLNVERVLINLR